MATKNFAANLKIGAVMSSSVGRVFGGLKSKIKDQESVLKKLRAEFKAASKGSGEFAGSLDKLEKEVGQAEAKLKQLKAASKIDIGGLFKGVGTSFAGDMKRVGVAAGLATAAIAGTGAAIYSVTRGFVDWADDIGDSAEALEMSTQALQTWQFAAATVGVGGAKMTASIAKFSKSVAEGGAATDETLGKLGLNAGRLRKLKLDDQLAVVAEAFKDYKGEIPRATLAMKLFGRSGYQLAGILAKGEEGFRDFRREGEKVGAILSDEAAAKAGKAAGALDMMGITMTGLRNKVAIAFVPTLEKLADLLKKLADENGPKIQKWAADFGKLIEEKVVPAIGAFAGKLPGIISNIGETATKFWDGLTAVKDFVGGWENLGIAIVAVNFAPTILALGNLAAGLWGVGAAVYGALGPFGLLAAAIVGFFAWYGDGNPIEGFKRGMRESFLLIEIGAGMVKQSFILMGEAIDTALTATTVFLTNKAKDFLAVFVKLAVDIKQAFLDVFDWIGKKFEEIIGKAAALGSKIKGFFSFGGGPDKSTAMNAAPTVAPVDQMPGRDRGTAQNNINIRVDAPGQDGTGIARQLRQELSRRPLFDSDGTLVPA